MAQSKGPVFNLWLLSAFLFTTNDQSKLNFFWLRQAVQRNVMQNWIKDTNNLLKAQFDKSMDKHMAQS